MAAMLQQQYVVQETEPRDWAACEITRDPRIVQSFRSQTNV